MPDQYGPYRKFKYNLEEVKKAIDKAEKECEADPTDRENEAFLSGLQVAYEKMGGVL